MKPWVPACAGMTRWGVLAYNDAMENQSSLQTHETYSRNVDWKKASIVSEIYSNGAGEFIIGTFAPINTDVSCGGIIENGIASFNCSTL